MNILESGAEIWYRKSRYIQEVTCSHTYGLKLNNEAELTGQLMCLDCAWNRSGV